jgi:hypothetical protein
MRHVKRPARCESLSIEIEARAGEEVCNVSCLLRRYLHSVLFHTFAEPGLFTFRSRHHRDELRRELRCGPRAALQVSNELNGGVST